MRHGVTLALRTGEVIPTAELSGQQQLDDSELLIVYGGSRSPNKWV